MVAYNTIFCKPDVRNTLVYSKQINKSVSLNNVWKGNFEYNLQNNELLAGTNAFWYAETYSNRFMHCRKDLPFKHEL